MMLGLLAVLWAGAAAMVRFSNASFEPYSGGYTSMVLGAQQFNVTGPAVFVGADDQALLCSGGGNLSVAALLRGAVAVVAVQDIFNRSCLVATQAVALEAAGCAGALFVFVETSIEVVAATWSVATGANVSALPFLFLPSYLFADLLLLNSSELQVFALRYLGSAGPLLQIISAGSNWASVSQTFGVVFQVVFGTWAAALAALALSSLAAAVRADSARAGRRCVVSLGSVCLAVEALGNAVRLVWFAVDPVLMRGAFPVELYLFLAQGLVSLTLMSVMLTAIFWTRVLTAGLATKPVTLRSLLPWIVSCAVVLILLEFLDGIVYFAIPGRYDEQLFTAIQFSVFAGVCLAGALFLLFSGTFLLRKVRVGDRLKGGPPVAGASPAAGRSRFARSIGLFVVAELGACSALAIWFLLAVWVAPTAGLLYYNNAAYWFLMTVYYVALQTASTGVVLVYYRRPEPADLPPLSSDAAAAAERGLLVGEPSTHSDPAVEMAPLQRRTAAAAEQDAKVEPGVEPAVALPAVALPVASSPVSVASESAAELQQGFVEL